MKSGLPTAYDGACRSLAHSHVEKQLSAGVPYTVRMRVEPDLEIAFTDSVYGHVQFNSKAVDDQVLMKVSTENSLSLVSLTSPSTL